MGSESNPSQLHASFLPSTLSNPSLVSSVFLGLWEFSLGPAGHTSTCQVVIGRLEVETRSVCQRGQSLAPWEQVIKWQLFL